MRKQLRHGLIAPLMEIFERADYDLMVMMVRAYAAALLGEDLDTDMTVSLGIEVMFCNEKIAELEAVVHELRSLLEDMRRTSLIQNADEVEEIWLREWGELMDVDLMSGEAQDRLGRLHAERHGEVE